ncbi:MAG: BON domain-containing protein [Acidobacteria bacterium]|nr:BON domain-containing protein [Acidobacteriota bacterium]
MTISPEAISHHEPEEWPTDAELQRHVREELEWTPGVDSARIGVSAHHGVVHLDGAVAEAAQAAAARDAALRVRGAAGLVDGLVVASDAELTDEALVERVLHALRHTVALPPEIRSTVHEGTVTLSGPARWQFERELAERTVVHLTGVRAVRNDIELTERPSAADTTERVRAALLRNASVDARTIVVRVSGTEVVLEGRVRSYAERQQAAIAAWSSPHVTQVHNRIHIQA